MGYIAIALTLLGSVAVPAIAYALLGHWLEQYRCRRWAAEMERDRS